MATPATPALRTFMHAINADDVITRVDDAWRHFAVSNGLDPDTVVGTRLWDHIAGSSARELNWYLLKRVRDGGQVITLPFRCDAPDRRRYMEMIAAPLEHGGVQMICRLLKEVPRKRVAVLCPDLKRTPEILKVCSWCRQAQVSETTWCEVEQAIAELNLFDEPLPEILHSTCPSCVATLSAF